METKEVVDTLRGKFRGKLKNAFKPFLCKYLINKLFIKSIES